MAVPKRKKSKSKIRMRKNSRKVVAPSTSTCSNCGQPHEPHRACAACGFYKGRQVLSIKAE